MILIINHKYLQEKRKKWRLTVRRWAYKLPLDGCLTFFDNWCSFPIYLCESCLLWFKLNREHFNTFFAKTIIFSTILPKEPTLGISLWTLGYSRNVDHACKNFTTNFWSPSKRRLVEGSFYKMPAEQGLVYRKGFKCLTL